MALTDAQQILIERLLNTRVTTDPSGNWRVADVHDVWNSDILDDYGHYPGGSDDPGNRGTVAGNKFSVANAFWRQNRFRGRYLVDKDGHAFPIRANTNDELTLDLGNAIPSGATPTQGEDWSIQTVPQRPVPNPKKSYEKHKEWLITMADSFKSLDPAKPVSLTGDYGDPDSSRGNAPDHVGHAPQRAQVDFLRQALDMCLDDPSGARDSKLALLGADNLAHTILNDRLGLFKEDCQDNALMEFSAWLHAQIPTPEWTRINAMVHRYRKNNIRRHGPTQHEFY